MVRDASYEEVRLLQAGTRKITAHEMLQINEALRIEAAEVEKLMSILSMMTDTGIRQEIEACIEAGRRHIDHLTALTQLS
jgi:hypothetical protein